MTDQVLDSMDLERKRGITIKAQSVSLDYTLKTKQYQMNSLIPWGMSTSLMRFTLLSACEGALLVVDASQGVEAQTVAICYTAADLGLEIIPVLNKIDLPAADPDRAASEIEDLIGLDCTGRPAGLCQDGKRIDAVLERIVNTIPAPSGSPNDNLSALIIDSWFDNYLGTVSLVRVKEGTLSTKSRILMMSTGKNYSLEEIGRFTPKRSPAEELIAGEVGYVVAGIKDIKAARVGDRFDSAKPTAESL